MKITLDELDYSTHTVTKEEKRRKRKRRIITIAAWTVTVIASLTAFVALGVGMFLLSGKYKLSNRTQGTAPNLVMEETSTDVSEEEDSSYVWQEGWIRYGDKIYEYNDHIITFLMMGIDKLTPVAPAKDATDGGQSDGLFLVVINPDEKDVKIIAINRDTIVDVYMYGFEKNGITPIVKAQITVQHGFGDGMEQSCEATVEAVSKLFFNLPINGYASLNMGAVGDLVDALGGVDLYVLEDMSWVNPDWPEGAYIHLEGNNAYHYVHDRDITVFESARSRLARQKQFLSVFISKLKEQVKNDLTLPVKLYSTLSKYMVTDITSDQVAYLATQLVGYDFDSENDIYTLEGTTYDGEHEEFYPDQDALRDLMIRIFYREVDLEE